MLPVTTFFASLLGMLYVKLALKVNRLIKSSISIGNLDTPEKVICAQGNFSEYVPIALILMACLELNGLPWWLTSIFGTLFTLGRVSHAIKIIGNSPFKYRLVGMPLTLMPLMMMSVLNLGFLLHRVFN